MRLEALDSYNIRVRLSSSIILLSPIIIILFFCFEETFSFLSSSVLVCILLAFVNYLPILQRQLQHQKDVPCPDYAVQFLMPQDKTIDIISKERYYRILASVDPSFLQFNTPSETEEFAACCKSAVSFMRNHTRKNRLVLEDNINYGFYKTLYISKPIGLTLCILSEISLSVYSLFRFEVITLFPKTIILPLILIFLITLFWTCCINKKILNQVAIQYAKTLISAVDTIQIPE